MSLSTRTIIWLLALVFSATSNAQSCSEADISLNTQIEVEAFQTTYGPCTEILGTLWVTGETISDLSPLSSIVIVRDLRLWNLPDLIDFDGFSGLETVYKSLEIADIYHHVPIDGFGNLRTVGVNLSITGTYFTSIEGFPLLETAGYITISWNRHVERISGFQSLTSVEGMEFIVSPKLQSIKGFSKLNTLGLPSSPGGLSIHSNEELSNLDAFKGIESIYGGLEVMHLDALPNLDGFAGLVEILGSTFAILNLSSNDLLRSLAGLKKLTRVEGDMNIGFNDSLLTTAGLEQLESVGGRVDFRKNFSLKDCTALQVLFDSNDDYDPGPAIGEVPDVGSGVYFWGDNGKCNSVVHILDQVFIDSLEVY